MRIKTEILVLALIVLEVRAELGNDSLQGPIFIRKIEDPVEKIVEPVESKSKTSREKSKKLNSKSRFTSSKVMLNLKCL